MRLLNSRIKFSAVIAVVVFIVPICGTFAINEGKLLYVQIKETVLRSQPKFLSSTVSKLNYGDPVNLIESSKENRTWIKVKAGESEGFINTSAITSRKIIISSKATNINNKVDPSTVVIAGKGFNKQVEGVYASSSGANYNEVNTVEGYHYEASDLIKFIEEGKLNG